MAHLTAHPMEHRLVSRPVGYGFPQPVRVSEARPPAASLAAYCRSHEPELPGICPEREAAPAPASAAFTRLLETES